MACIHLTDKWEKKIYERYHAGSYTDGWAGAEYSFDGVKSIKLLAINTVPIGDYKRNAFNPDAAGTPYNWQGMSTSRYGTPWDITDRETVLTMGEDKSFTYVIDKGEGKQQYNVKSANQSLDREIREVITPYMDKYRLDKWAREAGGTFQFAQALTKSNVAEFFIELNNYQNDRYLPEEGRVFFAPPSVTKILKLCDEFDGLNCKAERITRGHVGTFDGIEIVELPTVYVQKMCAHTGFVGALINKSALLAPMKMKEYKIHTDPPGYSGDLVEGRWMHDAFIVPKKRDTFVLCFAGASLTGLPTATPTVTVGTTATGYMACVKFSVPVIYTYNGADPLDEYANFKGGKIPSIAAVDCTSASDVDGLNYVAAATDSLALAIGPHTPNNKAEVYYRSCNGTTKNAVFGPLHRIVIDASGLVNDESWGESF